MIAPVVRPVIVFDGNCPLCVGSVRFVLRWDRRKIFRFAALDSAAARTLLRSSSADPAALEDVRRGETLVLVSGKRLYLRTDAALRIAAALPWPWKVLVCLRIVPPALRDRAYAALARHRHSIAGRLDDCPLPDEESAARFL